MSPFAVYPAAPKSNFQTPPNKNQVHLMKFFLLMHLHWPLPHLLLYGLTIKVSTFFYEEKNDLEITAADSNWNRQVHNFPKAIRPENRPQWACGLRRRSAAAALLLLWVRVPLKAWKFSLVFVACCVGSGLRDELITHSEEY